MKFSARISCCRLAGPNTALPTTLECRSRRINEIVKGKRFITADTALRLVRYFAWPAEVWLNLQAAYDRQTVEATMRTVLAKIQPCALAIE